jgi:hypothetical protein
MTDFTHAVFYDMVFTKDMLLDCVDLIEAASTNKDSLGLLTEILDGMLVIAAGQGGPC